MRTELREWDPPAVDDIEHSDDLIWPFTVGEDMSFELVESEGFEILPHHWAYDCVCAMYRLRTGILR